MSVIVMVKFIRQQVEFLQTNKQKVHCLTNLKCLVKCCHTSCADWHFATVIRL